jgi:hypothetical protein
LYYSFLHRSSAAAKLAPNGNIGTATHYNGKWDSGCMFKTWKPTGPIYGAAIETAQWNKGGACGGCINIKGPNGNRIHAMVTNLNVWAKQELMGYPTGC